MVPTMPQRMAAAADYDTDFALWAETQAAALREGRFADLDVRESHEEIDSQSRSERHALLSRLVGVNPSVSRTRDSDAA
jgi:hypothetical protein